MFLFPCTDYSAPIRLACSLVNKPSPEPIWVTTYLAGEQWLTLVVAVVLLLVLLVQLR